MIILDNKDEEFKKKLSKEAYYVMRQKGTEAPFTGKLLHNKENGLYKCAACNNELFSSDTKFDTEDTPGLEGWPSFDKAIKGRIEFIEDNSQGMRRTEVVCAKCKSHLGHLFDDPKTKTGKHFCINSCALDFDKQSKDNKLK